MQSKTTTARGGINKAASRKQVKNDKTFTEMYTKEKEEEKNERNRKIFFKLKERENEDEEEENYSNKKDEEEDEWADIVETCTSLNKKKGIVEEKVKQWLQYFLLREKKMEEQNRSLEDIVNDISKKLQFNSREGKEEKNEESEIEYIKDNNNDEIFDECDKKINYSNTVICDEYDENGDNNLLSEIDINVLIAILPFSLSCLLSWFGAGALLLDWKRPWIAWPAPCMYGALYGYGIGGFLAFLAGLCASEVQ